MRSTVTLFILVSLFLFGCKKDTPFTAQEIVDKAIEVSGGDRFENSTISFDFRDRHYKAYRDHGKFQLERITKDSLQVIRDVLSNDGFQRMLNDSVVKVADSMIPRYSSSVNSVHYFSVLPFGLNVPAVNKTKQGKVLIKNKVYYKIKVTFNQEGGGEDFEDVFMYYIDNKSFKTNYVSYSYNENDGVGLRFREAFNERFVNGIRFVDYNNYRPKTEYATLENLDSLFKADALGLLSKIELKNVTVN
ncbi:DUF6503 family protein [Changchengzhania lutea]|uniref:DUF6503 family protein n=1 Tax=Changchengzhania lutea TaxID=2049305 RepID=UPI00115DF5C4|nr:DUF6503 family protein [Changchengzhania lutea]